MKVSVLINNYNYEKYVSNAINSIVDEGAEIVVYDDGSTDNSKSILEQFGNRIKLITNENYGKANNQNQANAIYQAFLASTGDIICLLDSDDMFGKEKIKKITEIFRKDDEVILVQNIMREMDSAGNLSDVLRPVIKEVTDVKSYIYDKQNLFHLFVPTSGLSFRRSFLEKVLPLKEDNLNYVWADIRLSLQSIFEGKVYTIREPLTYYRIHRVNDSNVRGTKEGHDQYLNQVYSYFNSLSKEHDLPLIKYSYGNYLENTYFYININKEKIRNFAEEKCNLFIWGAGEAGQSIYHYLNENNLKCKGFIDANPERHGEKIMGLEVTEVDYSKNNKYIISPIHAFGAIKEQLVEKGFVENVDFIYPYLEV